MAIEVIKYDPETTYSAEELHRLELEELMSLFCQAKKLTLRNQKLSKILDDINLMRHILKG